MEGTRQYILVYMFDRISFYIHIQKQALFYIHFSTVMCVSSWRLRTTKIAHLKKQCLSLTLLHPYFSVWIHLILSCFVTSVCSASSIPSSLLLPSITFPCVFCALIHSSLMFFTHSSLCALILSPRLCVCVCV